METAAKNLTPKMASGGDILNFPALNRVDERQDNQHGPRATDCRRCSGKHDPQQCKFRDAKCFLCHKDHWSWSMSYLSSSYSHYFLRTYITNILQNYKEKLPRTALRKSDLCILLVPYHWPWPMSYLSSSYSHYFLRTYITNFLRN